jgi:predicted ATPase
VIADANGSGKSTIYGSVRLLADAALNSVVASRAREGGLSSAIWAGPDSISRGVRQGTCSVEPLAKRKVASLKLGFGSDIYGCSIDLGYPPPPPGATMFGLDPPFKRECIWHGPVHRRCRPLLIAEQLCLAGHDTRCRAGDANAAPTAASSGDARSSRSCSWFAIL